MSIADTGSKGTKMTNDQNRSEFLEDLYERYYKRLVLYCLGQLGQESDRVEMSEECAQETFMRATEAYKKLRSHPDIEGWLFQTAWNHLKNELAKRRRRAKRHAYSLDQKDTPEVMEPFDAIKAFVDNEVNRAGLEKLYDVLTQEQADILGERYGEELSIREIAQRHGMPEGTVKSLIHRTLKLAKAIFNQVLSVKK